MFNMGSQELILILIIALVVFGPGKLPEVGKAIGKGINEFKGAISGEGVASKKTESSSEEAKVKPVKKDVNVEEAFKDSDDK